MVRVCLRDDQYERIAGWLPGKASDPGHTAADNRLFVEAVLWVARTGTAAPLRALEQRLSALRPLGAARCLAEGFAQLAQDADFEAVFMDSTIVGAHQHAAGAPKKRVTKPSDEAGAD